MKFKRSSGILLHPTSLPGPDGIGDLGPDAYRWIDFLSDVGCRLWQVLPLGPTGYGDSPYQCFSAFAGNPLLVSATMLLEDELLTTQDLSDRPAFSDKSVDYGNVILWKSKVLDRAFARHNDSPSEEISTAFETFKQNSSSWLEDFALFMTIKESEGGKPWNQWPALLRTRQKKALEGFIANHSDVIEKHRFRQFLFFRQWERIKSYCQEKGILIIGDIPIFVAFDSADAWSHPDLFFLGKNGNPTVVAGVPPDYFSPTGQLWGNPLYRWDYHKESGYDWWSQRIQTTLNQVDIIRLDHFRGFAGYWEVPAGKKTAEKGKWVTGPGADFFEAIQKKLGSLPLIAEDLGEITPDVIALREQFKFPGMKIFQFAFASTPADPFLPHNFPENCIAYTGTHDNDTALGWYLNAPDKETDFCRRYLARSGEDISWDMIRAVWNSVAIFALAPMQDFLGLNSEARMNFPSKTGGYWQWRMPAGALKDIHLAKRIEEMNYLYLRSTKKIAEKGKAPPQA